MQKNIDEVTQWLMRYNRAGFSFFNTLCHDKKITQSWSQYQKRKPTDEEVRQWLTLPTQNYALVTGEISNIVVYDVDTKNGGDPAPFLEHDIYTVRTPSGGYHFYTLYDPVLAHTKHRRAQGTGDTLLDAVDVQSNGAVVFAPPTYFEGKGGYTVVKEQPIQRLPSQLLERVLTILAPEKQSGVRYTKFTPKMPENRTRPGDLFNAFLSWDEIMLGMGWTKVGRPNAVGRQFWRRPGKERPNEGISASTNYAGADIFVCYTESVPNVDKMKGYQKFSMFTQIMFDGDAKKAAANVQKYLKLWGQAYKQASLN